MKMPPQTGFSLLELLAALAILALGLLGMAALQLAVMREARTSLLQGEASLLAASLLERVRANPAADYGGLGFAAWPAAAADCAARPCSSAQLRAYDLAHWRCAINPLDASGRQLPACEAFGLAAGLPGGPCADETSPCASGRVALNGDVYAVSVRWAGPGGMRTVTLRMRRP